eukprot:gene23260-29471_t
MLLDHGGDDLMENLDYNGNSVLHHSTFNGHIECVRLLLETAADVSARNKKVVNVTDESKRHYSALSDRDFPLHGQHHRHLSDSDTHPPYNSPGGVHNGHVLPRPHTLMSPATVSNFSVNNKVRYSQSTPSLGSSSFQANMSKNVSHAHSGPSEPTTPDSSGYVTAENSAVKHASNGYRVLPKTIEIVDESRTTTTSFMAGALPDDGIQVYTKQKIINHKVSSSAHKSSASKSAIPAAVEAGVAFPSTPTRQNNNNNNNYRYVPGVDSFRSPSPARQQGEAAANEGEDEGEGEGEFADPLEVFEAVDVQWSVYATDEGHLYYLDVANGHSQWEDPRVSGLVGAADDATGGFLEDGSTHFPPKSPSPKAFEKFRNFGMSTDSVDRSSSHRERGAVIITPSKIDWDGELSATDDESDDVTDEHAVRRELRDDGESLLFLPPLPPERSLVLLQSSVLPVPVINKIKHWDPSLRTASLGVRNDPGDKTVGLDTKIQNLQSRNRFSLADDIERDKFNASCMAAADCEMQQDRSVVMSVFQSSGTGLAQPQEETGDERSEKYLDVIRGGGSLQRFREEMELSGESQGYILKLFVLADELQSEDVSAKHGGHGELTSDAVLRKNDIVTLSETLQGLKVDDVLSKYAKMIGMGVPSQNVLAKMKLDSVSMQNRNRLMLVVGSELEEDSANKLASQKSSSVSILQTLHWKALSPTKLRNSIWSCGTSGETDGSSGIADTEMVELEKLFAVNSSSAQSVTAPLDGGGIVKPVPQLRVLERKRAQNIAIGLVAFKVCGSHLDLMKAVCSLDTLDHRLSADHLENLRNLLPTDSEMKRMHDIAGSQHPAEVFVQATLMFYPELPVRLSSFIVCLNFTGNCEAVLAKFMKLISCCNQVLSSSRLAKLLKKMLAIGNVMNQGTVRGGASGFTLDSLLKMVETKGVDKRTSVLDYVVWSLLERGEERALEVIEDLNLVGEGAKLSGSETLREFDSVEKQFDSLTAELKRNHDTLSDAHVLSSPTAKVMVSQFHSRLEAYLREFEVLLSKVRKWRDVYRKKMGDTLEYFAEDRGSEKDKNSDNSLKIFGFKYPEAVPVRAAVVESADGVRNRLSRNDSSNNGPTGGVVLAPANSPEVIFTELQNLRKKYDAVVEYTVHLTAERDAIVSQLETSQRELVKEKSKKKSSVTADGDNSKVGDRKAADKVKREISSNDFTLLQDYLYVYKKLGKLEKELEEQYVAARPIEIAESWSQTSGRLPKDIVSYLSRVSQFIALEELSIVELFGSDKGAVLLCDILQRVFRPLHTAFATKESSSLTPAEAFDCYSAVNDFVTKMLHLLVRAGHLALTDTLRSVFSSLVAYLPVYIDNEERYVRLQLSQLIGSVAFGSSGGEGGGGLGDVDDTLFGVERDANEEYNSYSEGLVRVADEVHVPFEAALHRAVHFVGGVKCKTIVKILICVLADSAKQIAGLIDDLAIASCAAPMSTQSDRASASAGAISLSQQLDSGELDSRLLISCALRALQTVGRFQLRTEQTEQLATQALLDLNNSLFPNGQTMVNLSQCQVNSVSCVGSAQRDGLQSLFSSIVEPSVKRLQSSACELLFSLSVALSDKLFSAIVPNDCWTDPGLSLDTLLPQSVITQVGEHLLSLVQELEAFASSDALEDLLLVRQQTAGLAKVSAGKALDILLKSLLTGLGNVLGGDEGQASSFSSAVDESDGGAVLAFVNEWLAVIMDASVGMLLSKVAQITVLTAGGTAQLLSDLNYMSNVASAMGIRPHPLLTHVKMLLDARAHCSEMLTAADLTLSTTSGDVQHFARFDRCILQAMVRGEGRE